MSNSATVPPNVAAAIVKVMSGIKQLGKDDTNKFQRYDFVSVDKFIAAVGPLCASAGLIILQEEDGFDVATRETTDDNGRTKSSAWLTVKYSFTFVHSSGEAYGPLHRSVMVAANGAQAFGSAQSYALKQFMRAQFQIPTGDSDDADSQEAAPLPAQGRQKQQPKQQAETPAKPKPGDFWGRSTLDLNPKNDKTPVEFAKSFENALEAAPDAKAIDRLVKDNDTNLSTLETHNKDKLNALLTKVSERMGSMLAGG